MVISIHNQFICYLGISFLWFCKYFLSFCRIISGFYILQSMMNSPINGDNFLCLKLRMQKFWYKVIFWFSWLLIRIIVFFLSFVWENFSTMSLLDQWWVKHEIQWKRWSSLILRLISLLSSLMWVIRKMSFITVHSPLIIALCYYRIMMVFFNLLALRWIMLPFSFICMVYRWRAWLEKLLKGLERLLKFLKILISKKLSWLGY